METNLKDVNFDLLEKPLVEYIKRSNKKVGILVAGIHPDYEKVIVGFTLCSNLDKWDWIKTGKGKEKVHGFGKDVATKRAVKWESFKGFDNVSVPTSISKEFNMFILRCKAYYKDKKLSNWALRKKGFLNYSFREYQ